MQKRLSCRVGFLLASLVSFSSAYADELWDLNYDMPLRIEDADPTESGELDFQLSSRYERKREGENEVRTTPEVRYGFGERFHFSVAAVTYAGSAGHKESGDTEFEVHGRLNNLQSPFAIGLSLIATAPTGKESEGFDTEARLQLAQKIYGDHTRIILNGSWHRNASATLGETTHQYTVVLGLAHQIDETWLLALEGYREEKKEEREFENGVEVGFRHKVSQPFILAMGAGVGLGHTSPDYTATLGLQYSLGHEKH